jgi:hypothetical protein
MYHCEKCNRDFEKRKAFIGHCSSHNKIKKEILPKEKIERVAHNQYLKAKEMGISFVPSEKEIAFRKRRNKIAVAARWANPNSRNEMSLKIKEAIKRNPNSYSSSNVSGRTKLYDTVDSFGNATKLKGKWELWFSEWLNEHDIKWTNKIDGFSYEWNGIRTYFPDFYLIDFHRYVEIKGYERERDLAKWKVVENLIIIKQKEIKQILDKTFNLFNYIAEE